jgi:Zn-dependent protease with chaperone function
MEQKQYDALVARLEQTAEETPQKYLAAVVLVALLGFIILGIAIGFSLLAMALLVGILLLAIFSGGKSLFLLGKLGKLVFVLAFPAWSMVKSSFTMLFSRFPLPQGRELTAAEAPALFMRLSELRRRMAGPAIHKVLLTDELNAAIVQHPRLGLFGWEQNYLILGLPLLQVLVEKEALAVVAHEYGHLSGHHSRLGGFIYRFRAAWGRVQHLADQWDDWGSRLMARLFRWYAPYFNAYTFVLARQNEYIADRTSVEVAGLRNAANALMRIDVVARFDDAVFWPALDRRAARDPKPPTSRIAVWHESLRDELHEAARTTFLQAACQRATDHLDTHPSLKDRLAAIGAQVDDDSPRGLELPATSAATAWLGPNLPEIQVAFDDAWRERIAEQWQERHDYLRERHQRLAELSRQDTLSTDELWEQIRLIDELEPDTDLLPLVEELLAQMPEHLPARFRHGTLLLARGDAAGIADLEAVMEQEPEAILAGCEAAWRFYESRDAGKAETYRQRWQTHADHLQRVETERKTLSADAQLAPADLPAEILDAIRQIVERYGRQIRKAYVLRRVLLADSTVRDYVLAFETGRVTIGDKGPGLVKQLAQEEYPIPLFIVHLGTAPYKSFRKGIKRMQIAQLV